MSAFSERVLRELTGPAYAILDGGRHPRIRSWVIDTHTAAWCLYRGNPLPAAVEDAAPWLVRIIPGEPWVEQLFVRGWQQSWGIFLSSDAPSRELRRHLRRFLRVRTEDGRILAFRYYDPRVLRVYLPTCTPDEIAAFFGPVTAMIAEAEDRNAAHLFRQSSTGLDAHLLDLSSAERPRASAERRTSP